MSIFSAKLSHAHEEKRFTDIPALVRQALTQTSILFILGTLFVYVSMPYIMSVFFGDKFSTEQVTQMGFIFMLLSIYTFTIVLESPFARAVSLFRYYGYGMRLNFVFSAIVATGFLLLWLLNAQDAYLIFLGVLILAQLSNYWLYWKKYHQHMDERLALPDV
jgi:O-antigen/teichoic acid export membrane protein